MRSSSDGTRRVVEVIADKVEHDEYGLLEEETSPGSRVGMGSDS
jgi:hypothetical protein